MGCGSPRLADKPRYFPQGNEYLLLEMVRDKLPIYFADICNFIVDKTIADKLIKKKRKLRLKIAEIEILDKPLDGLPNNLSDVPKSFSQNQPRRGD